MRLCQVFAAVTVAVSAIQCFGEPTGLFARPRILAKTLPEAYRSVCESYYGMGNYAKLLCARLDTRSDGTPNIILDRDKGTAEFTVRLYVNDAEYKKWSDNATKALDSLALNSSTWDNSFENFHVERIAGKDYVMGANESAALKKVRKTARFRPEGKVYIDVSLVDSEGSVVRSLRLDLKRFERQGYESYPCPLYHLNRLKDLPSKNYKWRSEEDEKSTPDDKLEDAFAKFTLNGFTDEELSKIKDMRCTVVQEY